MTEKDEDQYIDVICPVECLGCGRIVPLDKMRGEGTDLLCPECDAERDDANHETGER